MNQQILVSLDKNSYPIEIQKGLIDVSPVFLSYIKYPRVLLISNPTIALLYQAQILKQLQQLNDLEVDCYHIEDGEKFKNIDEYEKIIGFMLKKNFGRDSLIVALGGGVVGDISGFVAATYQRGIPFIQIPTTLLAQIDASVGGKTAINHRLGKNMMGAFYQPQYVMIDPECLNTLSARDYRAGLGEAIKYGLLADESLFEWMEENSEALNERNLEKLQYLIKRCCEIKAAVVSRDEKETGERALLNLGHTFAHAIEAETSYNEYLHGEAVAIGLVAAMKVSVAMGMSTVVHLQRLETLLKNLSLMTTLNSMLSIDQLMHHMLKDKKNKSGQIHLVINRKIGSASVMKNISREIIRSAIPLPEQS